MDSGREDFANNIEVLKAALVGERGERIIEAARAARAEAELAVARAKASDDQALIAHQQLRIEKLTRQLYGPRSERTSRILDQIELRFEELESSATEDELAAEMAVAKTTTVAAFTRKRPARKPLPEHLPRERVIVPGPTTCLCCGGKRLRKLGETVTETLESVPRQWKVIQHVREKFTCRDCEKISQAPAMTRSLHPPISACTHRVRFVGTWREEFFEAPLGEIQQRYKGKKISFRKLWKGKSVWEHWTIKDVAQFLSAYAVDKSFVTDIEALLTRL